MWIHIKIKTKKSQWKRLMLKWKKNKEFKTFMKAISIFPFTFIFLLCILSYFLLIVITAYPLTLSLTINFFLVILF